MYVGNRWSLYDEQELTLNVMRLAFHAQCARQITISSSIRHPRTIVEWRQLLHIELSAFDGVPL